MFSRKRMQNWQVVVPILSILSVELMPSAIAASTSHIVSFVHQTRLKPKLDEFPDFGIRSAAGNLSGNEIQIKHSDIHNLGRIVQQIDPNIDNTIDGSTISPTSATQNSAKTTQLTDDMPNQFLNTLQNSTDSFGSRTQSELTPHNHSASSFGLRVKQSIPVLEPVRHLLNTVREGAINRTSSMPSHHTSHSKHPHQLVGVSVADANGTVPNKDPDAVEHHNSSAIETEEEREMVNESTSFHFLELLGTLGGVVWGFFNNVQKVFAASSANASAASSSSSSAFSQ